MQRNGRLASSMSALRLYNSAASYTVCLWQHMQWTLVECNTPKCVGSLHVVYTVNNVRPVGSTCTVSHCWSCNSLLLGLNMTYNPPNLKPIPSTHSPNCLGSPQCFGICFATNFCCSMFDRDPRNTVTTSNPCFFLHSRKLNACSHHPHFACNLYLTSCTAEQKVRDSTLCFLPV